MGIWAIGLIFMVLGTVWVLNRECAARCTRLFRYAQYMLVGMYVVEGLFLVTWLLMRFYRRSSGVEAVQDLINHLNDKANASHAVGEELGNPTAPKRKPKQRKTRS
jgi:hypothetical protein